jgi:hypothetical protein
MAGNGNDQSLIAYTAGQGITPATLGEACKLADMLAASNFVPNAYKGKPGDIIAAIQMGSEVGLKPMSALQSIAVINGRPAIFGDGYLAIITSSPAYERHEESLEGAGPTRKAVVKMWRKGNPTPFVGEFGAKEAATAGLASRDTYKQYADRMYTWRARHIAGQAGFSDVLKGLLPAEVAEDYPREVEATVVMPQRRSAAKQQSAAAAVEPAVMVEELPPDAHGDAWEPPASDGAAELFDPNAQPPAEQAPTQPELPPANPNVDERLISDPQRKRFYAIAKGAGKSDDQIKAYIKETFGVDRTDKLTRGVYEAACEWAAKK